MFDLQIKLIILYGSEIWDIDKWLFLERFQANLCKFVFGVGSQAKNVEVLGYYCRFGMHVDIFTRFWKYRFKLLSMSRNIYPRRCYDMFVKLF